MAILGLGAQGVLLWPGVRMEVVSPQLRIAWPAGLSKAVFKWPLLLPPFRDT